MFHGWQPRDRPSKLTPLMAHVPNRQCILKKSRRGKKIRFISIKWSLALRDELLLTRFYNGFLLWFWACSHCSLFHGPYMIWGRAGQERKEVPTLFGYCFLASNCLEVNLRLFPAFLPPFLMPNSHSLLLPHPFLHQKKAKVLTICLWLGKNVCSTRGNFSGPSELKILMSWENLGWGRGNKKQTPWMSVAYCGTGKCLQNVLRLVKEVRETCYYAFPTLLSWLEISKKIWSCCIYPGPGQPLYTNRGLRERKRGSRVRRGSVWV